jgi:hypothetical protein
MRRFLTTILLFFCLSANAQWEVVPSGTDSALYCVSSTEEHYFVGGVTNTLLKSPIQVLDFNDVHEEYGLVQDYSSVENGITKIGILNDTTLLFQRGTASYEVYDSNLVYLFWGGSGVLIDSNLVIIGEDRADVYVDTTVIEYLDGDPYAYGDAIATIGTKSWVLRSTDGSDSYDNGTVLNNFTFINSAHVVDARYVGCIDFDGGLFFSSDSAITFTKYQAPGLPYDFDENEFLNGFASAGFYFDENLIGFYAPRWQNSSSLYKVDMMSGQFTSMNIDPDYRWNRITMVGSQFVIAVGDSGMVATSFDQGETWTVENIGTELDLYGVDADDQGNLIVVGDSGLILTNSNPLITGIEIISEGGSNTIGTENGTLQLTAELLPASAPQEVIWSMINLSGTASIDQSGLVTAEGNGLVMAVASLPEPPGVNGLLESNALTPPDAHFFIQISGQELSEQYLFGTDTTLCGSDVFTVNLPDSNAEVEWSDGSTGSSFEISQFGTYWVTITNGNFVRSDTLWVTQFPYPAFTLGEDTTACTGDEITLEAPDWFSNYEWSTGSEESSITVLESGLYTLGITHNNCTSFDEIQVEFLGVGDFDLGEDVIICEGETTSIDAPADGEFTWSTGSNESSVLVDEEGWLVLEIAEGECTSKDSLFVTVDPIPQFELGADTTICDTASLLLDAAVSGGIYEWNNGSNEPTLLVDEEGYYEVVVTLGNCSAEDGITVSIQNCTLSTEDILSQKTKIYPNPAGEFVMIEIPSELVGCQIFFHTIEGKMVYSQRQNSMLESYSLNQLPSGNYILVFELEGLRVSHEIIRR